MVRPLPRLVDGCKVIRASAGMMSIAFAADLRSFGFGELRRADEADENDEGNNQTQSKNCDKIIHQSLRLLERTVVKMATRTPTQRERMLGTQIPTNSPYSRLTRNQSATLARKLAPVAIKNG